MNQSKPKGMKITHHYSGKSLADLYKEYGMGADGFFDDWGKDQPFWKKKHPKATYEINLRKRLTSKTYDEQLAELKEGETPLPAVVLCEAILQHYRKTGKRLLTDWWSRTEDLSSDGDRVVVGLVSDGVDVDSSWGDIRDSSIGLAVAHKTGNLEPPETLTEERVREIVREELGGAKIEV